MIEFRGASVRRVASWIGFPPGTGELIDQPTRRRLVLSLVGSVLLSGLDMLGVLTMLPLLQFVAGQPRTSGALGVIDRVLGHPGDPTLIGVVVGMLVACFVGKDLFALAFRRWQMRFMAKCELALSVRMLDYYLDGPYLWQLAKNTGDKVWTITTAVSAGYSGVLGGALAALTELLTITFIMGSLAFVSPWITLAALAYFAFGALGIQRVVRPKVVAASKQSQAAGVVTSQVALQALSSAKEVKLRRAGQLFVKDYRAARQDSVDASVLAGFYSELPKYVMEILLILGIGMLAFGIALRGDYSNALILLGLFAAAGSRIMPSAVRLLAALNAIRFAKVSLTHLIAERRLLDLARRDEESRILTDVVPTGDIELTGVGFSYPGRPDQAVLRDVDLRLPEGQTIALVGASGAGKSTLVDLLLGLLPLSAGVITAGGQDIHSNLPGWQGRLAVVPQDVVLFDDTLRANIAFELPEDSATLVDVVQRAQLADLVAQLPEGLDSAVGERGARLSGGQRQRIGIARALYRAPKVLFLDEATSAVDNETERRLTQTISSLRGEMTIIVVAHRLSTVRDCDQVVFLSGGQVVTVGTFDEVEARNDEFAHLVRLGSLNSGEAASRLVDTGDET